MRHIDGRMRIATFNVNSVRMRMDAVLAWLSKHQPDVLCLQETKVQDAEFPLPPLRDAGYHVAFKGMKAYNGVALLSRRPAADVRCGLDDGGPADEPRLIQARFGRVTVVNTYVPQGREIDHEMFQYKLQWFRRLRAYFDRHFTARDLLLWTGDLNVAAEPIDVYEPETKAGHVCYHDDARRAFADCRAWGFEDVFRRHCAEAGQYTFYDYRQPDSLQKGRGWRIDYLLASPALAKKSTASWIDLDPRRAPKASDHTVLAADFDL